jgi:hypothetical protein
MQLQDAKIAMRALNLDGGDSAWEEDKHPRDGSGKFSGSGPSVTRLAYSKNAAGEVKDQTHNFGAFTARKSGDPFHNPAELLAGFQKENPDVVSIHAQTRVQKREMNERRAKAESAARMALPQDQLNRLYAPSASDRAYNEREKKEHSYENIFGKYPK